MTSLKDHLATRRSISVLSLIEPGPDDAVLADIFSKAVRVPDHGKLAPWRFIVIRGEGAARLGRELADLAEAKEGPLSAARRAFEESRFTRAPIAVAVVSTARPHFKIPEWEQVLGAGAVTMNLIHAFYAHGFATNWITEWVCYDDDARAALGVTGDEKLAGFIYAGTPAEPPVERPRPALRDVVTEAASGEDGGFVPFG